MPQGSLKLQKVLVAKNTTSKNICYLVGPLWSTANASESTRKNHPVARLSVLGSIPSTLLLFVELSACTGTAERQRQHNVIDRRESGQRGDAGMLQANSPQQRWSFPAAQHSRRRL